LALGAIPSLANLTLGVSPSSYTPGFGTFDTVSYSLFAYELVPAVNATDNALSSWSFYGLTTNPVAPVIYSGSLSSGSGSLNVVWIGSPVTPSGAGIQTYSISGAPTLVAGEYLGWQDDGPINGSSGNIAFTGQGYGGPDGSGLSYDNNVTGPAAAATSYSFINANTNLRNYYAEFTLTPEPGFYGLLALGLGGLATVVSRRKKAKA
jgi:hypothetical protein